MIEKMKNDFHIMLLHLEKKEKEFHKFMKSGRLNKVWNKTIQQG